MKPNLRCINGCPPGTDLRTCMLAFMAECPIISGRDGDIFFDQKQQELFD